MANAPARLNLLDSAAGRRWLFGLLYLSEGAPIGFVWWAMPTLLRGLGLALDAITTLTAIATLPWVLKFLVAPFIDANLHRGGTISRWIVICQLAMAFVLLPLVSIDWTDQFSLVIMLVAAHAVFAAVQDVGIDTLAIHVVPRNEFGRINGWMQAGMLGGRAGVAAGSTLIAEALGDPRLVVLGLAALILLPVVVLVFAVVEPPIPGARLQPRAVFKVLTSRAGVAGLLVALIVGAGFEFFGVSIGPRLVDLGEAGGGIAVFFGFIAPIGLATGALVGGVVTDRFGSLRSTGISLAVLSLILCWVALSDWVPVLGETYLAGSASAYFAIGALTASSYALFMVLSRGEFAATRFSLFMAATNACEAWAGFVGGMFASFNYGLTLVSLTAVAGLAAIPLYVLSRQRLVRVTDE